MAWWRDIINIRDWKIINALYYDKNITKVAHRLYISQPALTARIKKIEEHFDVKLIIRGRRGIKFTPEGEYIAQRAKEIIDQHDKIQRHVLNMKNDFSGVLKIGASKYIAKYKLPKLLRFFKERFPNIECEVITGWSGDISRKIRDREVDVAFIRADYPWHGSRVTLFEEEMWAVYTEEFEWNDLLEIPFIKRRL